MPMFGFPFRLVSSAEVKVAGAGGLASRPPAAVLGDGQAPAERVATVCPSLRETKVSAPLPEPGRVGGGGARQHPSRAVGVRPPSPPPSAVSLTPDPASRAPRGATPHLRHRPRFVQVTGPSPWVLKQPVPHPLASGLDPR